MLTFDCLVTADRGDATLALQHASDPVISNNWTSVPVPGAVGTTTAGDVQFVVTDPAPPGGLLHIVATLQPSTGKLFARLRAALP